MEIVNNANDFAELFNLPEEETPQEVSTEVIDNITAEEESQIVDLTQIEETPSNTEPEVDNSLIVMFNYLKEKQALRLPEEYEFDGSEEEFDKALSFSNKASQQTTFNEVLESLPPDYRDTILFGLQTGKPLQEFLAYTNSFDLNQIDLNQESDQVKLLNRYYTQVAKLSPERAEKFINTLKDTGELQNTAFEYYDEIKDLEHNKAQELILEEQNRREAEARKAYAVRVNLNNAIDESQLIPENIRGNVKAFLFNEVVRNNTVTTDYNRTLQHIQSNPEHLAQLASILMDYKPDRGLVLDRFTSQAKSNTVRSIKEQLANSKTNLKSNVSGNAGSPQKQNFDWDAYLAKLG